MDKNLFNRTISEIRANIDLPVRVIWERYGTPEYWKSLERELKREAENLEEFIRDHRSRDSYGISIEKQYVLTCKFCGCEYPDNFNGVADCCEKMIEAQGIENIEYKEK